MSCYEPLLSSIKEFRSNVKNGDYKLSPCGVHTSTTCLSPCLCTYYDRENGICTPCLARFTSDYIYKGEFIPDTIGYTCLLCFCTYTAFEGVSVSKSELASSIRDISVDNIHYIMKKRGAKRLALYRYVCCVPFLVKKYALKISKEKLDDYLTEVDLETKGHIDAVLANNDRYIGNIVFDYLNIPTKESMV